MNILTEEELKKKILTEKQIVICELLIPEKITSEAAKAAFQDIIISHRAIQERNRNLVLENDEQTAEIVKLNNRINGMQEVIERQDILISQVVDEL